MDFFAIRSNASFPIFNVCHSSRMAIIYSFNELNCVYAVGTFIYSHIFFFLLLSCAILLRRVFVFSCCCCCRVLCLMAHCACLAQQSRPGTNNKATTPSYSNTTAHTPHTHSHSLALRWVRCSQYLLLASLHHYQRWHTNRKKKIYILCVCVLRRKKEKEEIFPP